MTDAVTGDVLVIGFGSELRRDDVVGRRVAEEIERRSLDGVTVGTTTQLVPELVESIARVDRVVFVDASIDAREVSVDPVVADAALAGSHHMTPQGLLGLMAQLDLPIPPAHLVEVPAFDLSLGEGLSERAESAAQQAVAVVTNLLDVPPSSAGGAEPEEPAGKREGGA